MKNINVKVNRCSLTFVTRPRDLTFSNNISYCSTGWISTTLINHEFEIIQTVTVRCPKWVQRPHTVKTPLKSSPRTEKQETIELVIKHWGLKLS